MYKLKNDVAVQNKLTAQRVQPSVGLTIPSWVTSKDYIANEDFIIESNKLYKCLVSHTSGVFATDLAANNWVEVSAGDSNPFVKSNAITQAAHGFVIGDVVYNDGSTWLKGVASAGTSIAQAVVSDVVDANTFKVIYSGELAATAHGKTVGDYYWLDQTTAGATTNTQPSTGIVQGIYHVRDANTLLIDISPAFTAGSSTATVPLTYGRVSASADLPNTSFVITGTGTKIPFNSTVYSSGTTFLGTDSIIPSVTGRYRADFFAQAGSGQFNGNGTFHIVQGGVSVGSVYVDMMEAAGVNQTTPTIDVNLAAGTAVELRFQPDVADSIIWQRGSYFQLTQLPTAVAPVVNTIAEYGEQILASTPIVNTTADITNGAFTLPSAGVWDVEYFVFAATVGGNETATVFITDPSNVVVPNSYGRTGTVPTPAGNTGNMVSQKVRITTTGSTNYKLRATTAGTQVTVAAGGATSKVTWTKIAGQLPSTGTTVDYVLVSSATLNQTTTANSAVIFPTILSGNIPYNTTNGQFTLTAGKTYRLTGSPTGGGAYWYNVTGAVALSEDSSGGGTSTQANLEAVAYFTPSVNSIVELRATITSSFSSGNGLTQGSYTARIEQMGSTNTIGGNTNVADQSSAGYFDIGNMRMQWGSFTQGSSALTVTLPVPFANANYSLTGNDNTSTATNSVRGTSFSSKTTTDFITITNNAIAGNVSPASGNTINWIAIGQKP